MTVRVGINGFGRIGRSFFRALLARGADAGVELVAVNDPMGDSATMAFLLKHDSVGGVLANSVEATDDGFTVDGNAVPRLGVMDPGEIPWADYGVDVAPKLKTLKVTEPPKRQAGIKVKTVAELLDKLKNEAGVI